MYTQYSVCAQTKFCNSIYTNFPTSTRVSLLLAQISFHFHHVCPHFVPIIASIIPKPRGRVCFSIAHLSAMDAACSFAIFQRYTIVIGFNFLCLSVAPALRSFPIPGALQRAVVHTSSCHGAVIQALSCPVIWYRSRTEYISKECKRLQAGIPARARKGVCK